MSLKRRIRVLIVDDSALVRGLLSDMLKQDPQIEVVGTASDAHVARDRIKALNPDVLTLDVEMPKMDGITFLRNLMRLRPMPVVMVSSLTDRGADVTLDALSIGAVDYLPKPKTDVAGTLGNYADELIDKVKAAAAARIRTYDPQRTSAPSGVSGASATSAAPTRPSAGAAPAPRPSGRIRTTDRIIAIGASTGGTEAIKQVLVGLPPDMPGIVITQHIPKAFSTPFARRMDDCCSLSVCEAQDGQPILAGHVYISPGDQHLLVVRDGAHYVCRLDNGEPVNRHKPSVDVLFQSVAENAGPSAIGVLLTGMGKDGAQGLLAMRKAGSITAAQDEASSVVWGMPGEAVHIGAVEHVLPLNDVAHQLVNFAAVIDITREARRG